MNPAAFGATTQLPLADCPFKRSALTKDDAEREVSRMSGEPPVIITTDPIPEVLLHPLDEEELQRDYQPERKLQALIGQAQEFAADERKSLPFVFIPSQEIEDVAV